MKIQYIGQELDLFKDAVNWKKYFSNHIKKYIKGDILEVGAGSGVNTKFFLFDNNNVNSITCLEPDTDLYSKIKNQHQIDGLIVDRIVNGTLLDIDSMFDSIIYIDVLEHIEDSKREVLEIKKRLKPNGVLIILVPAYQFLYSKFDKSVGHYRRYNKNLLRKDINNELQEKDLFYLDSLGFLASFVNKIALNKGMPSKKNIMFWDKILVPLSNYFDKLLFKKIGKSLIGIYFKN